MSVDQYVTQQLTREAFDQLPYLDRSVFRESARARFNRLARDYALRKWRDEGYPIQGNLLLSQYLQQYVVENLEELQAKPSLRLLDSGSAGGALTAMFALRTLATYGLLEKTTVFLVDIAEVALSVTKSGTFFLDHQFIEQNDLRALGTDGELLRAILARAEVFCSEVIALPPEISEIDFCLSGFTHHHLNLEDKALACTELERVARTGAFVGVVDERCTYEEYLAWLAAHFNDRNSFGESVPVAVESFIDLATHQRFFQHTRISATDERNHFYCFCGTRR